MRKEKNKTFHSFDTPSFTLNNFSVSIFNKLYFNSQKNKKSFYVDWDSYFYPLDSIGNWNRIYGKKGFFQFQCILPNKSSKKGYKKILSTIRNKSSGAFLAVLKNLGSGNGYLSFPRDGLTLALDFKVTKKNISVGQELLDIVNDFDGNVYLAKDSIMKATQFNQIFKKDEFLKFRHPLLNSEQSKRLNL